MKRAFDFIISLIGIIILSPIILIISIIIKLTSEGPIFFKQRRVGKNNKEFSIYKFRTMRIDTPNVATHLLENPEQYITAIGKFMRKTSLDELPQLFNIIKGDMSIVGPRPALYNQYDLIEMRTKVGVDTLVPGLTGWAQINGRNSITWREKFELDVWYVDNWSIWLDIKIFFLTFWKVIKREGINQSETVTMEYFNGTN